VSRLSASVGGESGGEICERTPALSILYFLGVIGPVRGVVLAALSVVVVVFDGVGNTSASCLKAESSELVAERR